MSTPSLNEETRQFVNELQGKPEVEGIILFGSWARGDNRPDSDVDLVVILQDGYRRAVERRGPQVFEIIYTTETGAFDFWESHRDDAAGLWESARALFDRDGTIARLRQRVQDILREGKKPIDEYQREQLRFDAEDQIRYAERVLDHDPVAASFILTNKVLALTEAFFNLRQLWTPGPKQRMARIRETDPVVHSLFEGFFAERTGIREKAEIARKLVAVLFPLPRGK